jgi:hypothetical protein
VGGDLLEAAVEAGRRAPLEQTVLRALAEA